MPGRKRATTRTSGTCKRLLQSLQRCHESHRHGARARALVSRRGASGGLFAGGDIPALDAAFTVFELAELKGRNDVQAVVLMLVVFLATQRMYHGDRTVPKAIVIDEAWDLLSGDDSRAFIEGAARDEPENTAARSSPAPNRSTTTTPIPPRGRPGRTPTG